MDEFDDAIRGWKVRLEQIEGQLSRVVDFAGPYPCRLIEEKQKLEGEIANVGRIREARKLETSPSAPGGESGSRPPTVGSSKGVSPSATGADAAEAGQAKRIERGKFCDQVIDEVRRIRNLCLETGRSVAEIQNEHPDWAVWKVRESLSPEDQDTFNHPRLWGAPVGYAKNILAKSSDVGVHTITSRVKAYRKSQRSKKR